MERAWKRITTLAIAVAMAGCAAPRLELDGATPPDADATDADATDAGGPDARSGPEAVRVDVLGGGAPILPFGGPTASSPPECPDPSDPAFCVDCYSWTDGGPDSLGRNGEWEEFGSVARADFNGDGYLDFAVGAPGADEFSPEIGAIFVYLGSEHGFMPWRRLISDTSAPRLGHPLATGDFDGDGDEDLVAGFGGLGIVVFKNGGDFNEMYAVLATDLLDWNGDPLSTTDFARSIVVADLDVDGKDDIILSVPTWSNLGAVYIRYGNGADQWIMPKDTELSYDPGERFGTGLAVRHDSSGPVLLVGLPGCEYVAEFSAVSTGLAEYVGYIAPSFGLAEYGRTILVRDDVVLVGGTGLEVEVVHGGAWRLVDALPRPVLLADMNADSDPELFSDQDYPYTKFYVHYGIPTDPYSDPVSNEVQQAPARGILDDLGRQAVAGDWDLDGYEDVAFGVPEFGDKGAGYVFGYHGGEDVDWPAGTFKFDDEYFYLDQETSLECDRCSVLGLPDGEPCPSYATGICVDYACVPRACGDGYRQPGPSPAREGCDDRNTAGGDACSSTCAPTAFVIAARPGTIDAPPGIDAPSSDRAVGIDGQGQVLVAWAAEHDGETRVVARRYTRYGVPIAPTAPLLELARIAEVGWDPQINVAGDPVFGWGVTWRQPAGSEVGTVVFRRIVGNGALEPAVRIAPADETYAEDASVVATGYGQFVIAWTDVTVLDAPRVEARRLAPGAGPVMDLGLGSDPAIASRSGNAVVVWVDLPDLGDRPRVLGANITSTTVSSAFEIATDARSPSIAAGTSSYHVAYIGHGGSVPDPRGDVFVRALPLTGAPTTSAVQVTARTSATDPARAETSPSIVSPNGSWIVAWEEPAEGRVRLAAAGSLPGEYATLLLPELTDVLAGDVSLAATPRGTWVVWSSAYEPASGAARATWGFILPPS